MFSDHLAMTIAVDLGCKATKNKQNKTCFNFHASHNLTGSDLNVIRAEFINHFD